MDPARQLPEIDIVYMDPDMTQQQVALATKFIYQSHKLRPIVGPVSVKLTEQGGFVVNEGKIVTMTPREVADNFKNRLRQGDHSALQLNSILCKTGEA